MFGQRFSKEKGRKTILKEIPQREREREREREKKKKKNFWDFCA